MDFGLEFDRLREKLKTPGSSVDVLEENLDLLQRIKFHYIANTTNLTNESPVESGSIYKNDSVYLECRSLCDEILGSVKEYLVIENYEKRLRDLDDPQLQPTDFTSAKGSLDLNRNNPIDLSNRVCESSFIDIPRKFQYALPKSRKSQKKRTKKSKKEEEKEDEFDYSESYRQKDTLSNLAIISLREVLLADLRQKYAKRSRSIKREFLENVYGPLIKSPEGLLSILEEIYESGINVYRDPVFMKVSETYSSKIEKIDDKGDKFRKSRRLKRLDKRYSELMDKVDLIGEGIKQLNNKRLIALKKKRKERKRELEAFEPSDKELRTIEEELEGRISK
jgi:hypothetical protein